MGQKDNLLYGTFSVASQHNVAEHENGLLANGLPWMKNRRNESRGKRVAITQYETYILIVMPAHAVRILHFAGIKCRDLNWWLSCCDVFQSLSVALSHIQYKGKHQGVREEKQQRCSASTDSRGQRRIRPLGCLSLSQYVITVLNVVYCVGTGWTVALQVIMINSPHCANLWGSLSGCEMSIFQDFTPVKAINNYLITRVIAAIILAAGTRIIL